MIVVHSNEFHILIFFLFIPFAATSMNSTIDRSPYGTHQRNYSRMILDTNSSQQNLNQTQMTTIPQTPENPYGGYDSMPSNYR